MKLPIRLGKVPIIDATFEVRFKASASTTTLLPGLLYGALKGEKIERLPMADFPERLRASDPNLRYAPVARIEQGQFLIVAGGRAAGVGCKRPYPGWNAFREAIHRFVQTLSDTKIIEAVERCSIKYVNVLSSKLGDPSHVADFDLRFGRIAADQLFQLRTEVREGGLIHILQVSAGAEVTLENGEVHSGLLVDIDSIDETNDIEMKEFVGNIGKRIENLHLENKKLFFGSIRPETIEKLEPVYE